MQVQVLAFNKPYGVLSQFTPEGGHRPLAEFGFPPGVYPIGRLDHDSEGLLLLSAEARVKTLLSGRAAALPKTYWVQVEGRPEADALASLEAGVVIQGIKTRPAKAVQIPEPELPPRTPPVRFRKTVPDAWLEITLTEGRNRQVRRMTAAVGLPTLRLVRVRQAGLFLPELALSPGAWKSVYIRLPDADNWRTV